MLPGSDGTSTKDLFALGEAEPVVTLRQGKTIHEEEVKIYLPGTPLNLRPNKRFSMIAAWKLFPGRTRYPPGGTRSGTRAVPSPPRGLSRNSWSATIWMPMPLTKVKPTGWCPACHHILLPERNLLDQTLPFQAPIILTAIIFSATSKHPYQGHILHGTEPSGKVPLAVLGVFQP